MKVEDFLLSIFLYRISSVSLLISLSHTHRPINTPKTMIFVRFRFFPSFCFKLFILPDNIIFHFEEVEGEEGNFEKGEGEELKKEKVEEIE